MLISIPLSSLPQIRDLRQAISNFLLNTAAYDFDTSGFSPSSVISKADFVSEFNPPRQMSFLSPAQTLLESESANIYKINFSVLLRKHL
jgi:hypothetical protein